MERLAGVLAVLFMVGFAVLLYGQTRREITPPEPDNECGDTRIKVEGPTFVPVEDAVVPTHASQTNKFNNNIGGKSAAVVGPALPEVVVHSDWYYNPYLPTEFDGPYWPRGTVQYDYIYPGSDPKRPLLTSHWRTRLYGDLVEPRSMSHSAQ